MSSVQIAVLEGDGIGPDIVDSTMLVLQKAGHNRGVDVEFEVLPSGIAAVEADCGTLPESTLEKFPYYPVGSWSRYLTTSIRKTTSAT